MSDLFSFGFSGKKKEESEKKASTATVAAKSKTRYEKEKRKRKFSEKWRDEFTWLSYDEERGLMFCVPCKQNEKNGRFVEGTDNFRVDAIKVHAESSSHISHFRNYEIKQRLSKSPTSSVFTTHTGEIASAGPSASGSSLETCQPAVIGPLDIAVRRLNEDQKAQLTTCFNTAYFVAKEELPFSMYPSILELQEKNGVILPSSYRTDQSCRRFMEFIYDDIQKQSRDDLKNARVCSIMFDGATDVSTSENEIVYARVVVEGIPRNIFVKIQSVEHAHAQGVLQAIETSMDSVDPGWDWKSRLIATGSDGASVNLGKRHSVAKLLKDNVPHLIAMHCVSHRLELGAIDAMKERDGQMFSDLKTVLMAMHKHYHYSAKALRELQLLADALDEKMAKPVNLSGTRWMPHLSRCLDVLLSKYTVLVTHFENTLEGRIGTVDVQARARKILHHLKDYKLLHYMHFLKDVLIILSELSLEFQKNSCGLPEASEALETACLRLVALQQRPAVNLQHFLDTVTDDHIYKNVQLSNPTLTPEQFKAKQDTLVDLVIDHISHRIGDIESDQLLKAMQVFYPNNLPEAGAERAVYGEESVTLLCDHYSVVLERIGCDMDRLRETEWPGLKVHMARQPRHDNVSDFYNRMFTNQNLKDRFNNILMLVEIVLCVPVSSAICERGFSTMARIKSDWRSKLDINMLNQLMAISIEGPSTGEYNAHRALELWWHGGQRARRPVFEEVL